MILFILNEVKLHKENMKKITEEMGHELCPEL